MKAKDRCKEHYQGDRCRKATGHDYKQVEPDLVHEGVHNSWTVEANPVDREDIDTSGWQMDRYGSLD